MMFTAGLDFVLDRHQHAALATKLSQNLQPMFPDAASGPTTGPADLKTALQLYLWAVASSHSEYTRHRPECTESELMNAVNKRLYRYTADWHSDVNNNPNCIIPQYQNGVAADKVYRCDHVIPKRSMPTVKDGTISQPVDTLIGEIKWRTHGRLTAHDNSQKTAEVEHVKSGFAKCLVWWRAQYMSPANLAWEYTKVELQFHDTEDCADCKQWLSLLGLLLQL